MSEIFLKILNMSIIASYIIVAAVLIRFLFKKLPKWINCVIWGMVGLRLVFPFSIKSIFSIIPRIDEIQSNILPKYFPIIDNTTVSGNTIANQITPIISTSGMSGIERSAPFVINVISVIWIVGI